MQGVDRDCARGRGVADLGFLGLFGQPCDQVKPTGRTIYRGVGQALRQGGNERTPPRLLLTPGAPQVPVDVAALEQPRVGRLREGARYREGDLSAATAPTRGLGAISHARRIAGASVVFAVPI